MDDMEGANVNDLACLWPYLRRHGRDLALAVGLILIETVFEMVIPLLMTGIVDYGVPSRDTGYLLRQGGWMVLCALLALVTGLLYARYAARAAYGFGADLRRAQFEQMQAYDFANLDRFSSASLVTRMTADVTVMQNAVSGGLRPLVRAPVMFALGIALSFWLNPGLSAVFLVSSPILGVILALIVRKVGPLYSRQQRAVDALNSRVRECLTAIRAVKAFVRGAYEQEQFDAVNRELTGVSRETFRHAVLNMPAFHLVMYAVVVSILWQGGRMILIGGMTVGDLTAFLSYVLQVMNSLMLISGVFLMLTRSLASARRIREVLEERPELADPAEPVEEVPDGRVELRDVSFRYHQGAERDALSHVSLTIPTGQTVGIIGGTGSAKTTLVQLIPRLYEATEGTVLVGGHPVGEYRLSTLRGAVGIVLQKNVLFAGTVRENLRWGDPEADDGALWAACRQAGAEEFLRRMPEGLDTHLEQGGVNLSGGQRQRLCIARTLLQRPRVLIFDDSTSAVDTATAARIRQALRALEDVTKIIISQRIVSVMEADQIVILEDGRVHAVGTHESLLASAPIYQEIYHSQQRGGLEDGQAG